MNFVNNSSGKCIEFAAGVRGEKEITWRASVRVDLI